MTLGAILEPFWSVKGRVMLEAVLGLLTQLRYREGGDKEITMKLSLILRVIGLLKEWLNQMTLQMEKVKTEFRMWSSHHKQQ